jgi:hypothetical protein
MDEERRQRVTARQQHIAQTLIRAADDPQLRAQLLDDPKPLFGGAQEARLPQPEHVQELRRQIASHLIERAADPAFRELLNQDLFVAIRTAGLTPRMEQLRAELPVHAEVTGYNGWGDDWWSWGWGWGR